MTRHTGRTVIVTGAASGIGAATAALLAAEGATVAAFDRSAVTVDGGRGWAVDLADPDAVTAAVAAATGVLGPPDAVVNCAGVSVPTPIDGDSFWDAWSATLAVNLEAYVRVIRAALPAPTASPAGRIVNVASTEGLGPRRTSRRTRSASTGSSDSPGPSPANSVRAA